MKADTEKIINVSIILISWKMKDLLKKCLESIYKFTDGICFEIILIDNNSLDGTSEMIKNEFPSIKLITNNRNKGVAPARNQGLKIAQGKYVLILDADMELTENSLLQLYNFMESNKSCGLVGCKLVDTDLALQYSCKRFPTITSLLSRRLEIFNFVKNSKTLNYHLMKDWNHKSIVEVDYVIGACQFFRKEIIDKIGYYDDKIFYGPEDLDFCLRIWRIGYKVCYYPLTSIIHYEQRITKKNLFSTISFKHFLGILYIFKKYNFSIKRQNNA